MNLQQLLLKEMVTIKEVIVVNYENFQNIIDSEIQQINGQYWK